MNFFARSALVVFIILIISQIIPRGPSAAVIEQRHNFKLFLLDGDVFSMGIFMDSFNREKHRELNQYCKNVAVFVCSDQLKLNLSHQTRHFCKRILEECQRYSPKS
jgi:hypothetical protein